MNYFDVAVGSIVLLLGLKGLMNGFSKELFGLIGIVGGLFVASHIGGPIGRFLNESLLHFETSAAVNLVGFVFTVGIFWLLMIALGAGFKRLSSLSGLGIVDQILGFFVGASKFFFIMSVIVYALFSVTAIRENFGAKMKDSIFFEPMVATGNFILHIETSEVLDIMRDNNQSDSNGTDDKDQVKEK
ncbi:MAG: CvpA family protein [Epsilonproteobacteria bacterium]|nr:CvpA family protein [Campylobacterota bacterium]